MKRDFGGMSWHGEVHVQAAKGTPALSAVVQIGWEPGTRQATIVSYDSMGSVLLGIGPLSGESVTFAQQGYMMGMKVKARETFTKKGPKELFHSAEIDMGNGFQRVSVGAASTDELPARCGVLAATALRTSSRISRTLWLRAVDA